MSRTNLSGPVAGFYTTFPIYGDDFDAGAGEADIVYRFAMPFACRVVEITQACSAEGGNSPRVSYRNISQGSVPLISSNPAVLTTTPITFTPTSGNFLINRNFARGDVAQIIVNVTTGGATTVDGFMGTITVYTKSHVVAAAIND